MIESALTSSELSRRDFLSSSAAAATAAAFPMGPVLAQSTARYRRLNVSDPQATRVLDSYKKAIRAMLALPPTDPRNWYRNALVHTLDCPHGNWWFPPWHRGYLGYFEQTCRELSGDPTFALPYWDWTKEPRVPAAMFDDVLTPTNNLYIAGYADFKAQFQDVVKDYWSNLSNAQLGALLIRCYRNPDDLWWDIENYPMFFDRPNARGLTAANPDFDPTTVTTVSLPTVLDALAPRDYITFGSAKTRFHSSLTGFGVLEGQPHNRVHNAVGGAYSNPAGTGFMQDNLSPVDPLFFLHHGNIDRLWDVWTRKQQSLRSPSLPNGYPTLPQGDDLTLWSNEKFLFFVDSRGQPASKTSAGDYATIGDFSYDYQPGSGEEVVRTAPPAAAVAGQVQRFSTQITSSLVLGSNAANIVVTPPPTPEANAPDAQRLFAKITIALSPLDHTNDLRVLVGDGGPAGQQNTIPLSMFGRHLMQGPVTFTVPLSASLATQRAGARRDNASFSLRVVQGATATHQPAGRLQAMTASHDAGAGAEVLSVEVEAH